MKNNEPKTVWEDMGITKAEWLKGEMFDEVGQLCPNCGSYLFELAEEEMEECFHVWRECPNCDYSGDHYDC